MSKSPMHLFKFRPNLFRLLIGFVMAVNLVTTHGSVIRVPGQVYWVGPYGGHAPGKLYGSAAAACNSSEFRSWYGVSSNMVFAFVASYPAADGSNPRPWCWFTTTDSSGVYTQPLTVVAQRPICPDGFLWSGTLDANACTGNWAIDPNNYGTSDPKICNPINPATGNKYQIESDYLGAGPFPLNFQRTYNAGIQVKTGVIGANWHMNFDRSISLYPAYALVHRPDGKIQYFALTNAIFTAAGNITDKLTALTNGSGTMIGYQYAASQGDEVETYDVNGTLLKITSRSGLTQTFAYDSQGRLSTVTDGFNRHLTFAYDSANRIATMTDPLGGIYQYNYDEQGNLANVVYPGGVSRIYQYNESAYTGGTYLPAALTGITDENGVRFAIYQYDSTGKAISTEHAGGADKATLSYSTDNSATVVTDPLGTIRTYNFQTILGVVRSTGQNQPAGSGCSAASNAITYDANGNISSRTDFNGNKTTYVYDLSRNLEISRVEAFGTTQARSISTQWHSTYRLPVAIAEPLRKTTFSYDPSGNLLNKIVQATTDVNGSQGFSAQTVGTPRTWNYTYNSVGQVLTATGPRTDINDTTTYAYDNSTGNLLTITNAAGQITILSNYDLNGRVGTITDPNGLTTNLTYYPRGWLKSKVVSGGGATQTTNYFYDGVGQLTSVTLPDNSSISYIYDPAHRLTDIADSLNNHIHYTLDAMGNRLSEQVNDPSNVLVRQTTRIYDALNRLQQVTGATQ